MVVGLYRTTGEKDETKDAVKGSDGKQVTLALNSGNGWKGTFDDLVKYDVDGDGKEIEYTYYARELNIGGEPAEKADLYIHNHDGEAKDTAAYTTKIVNVRKDFHHRYQDLGGQQRQVSDQTGKTGADSDPSD